METSTVTESVSFSRAKTTVSFERTSACASSRNSQALRIADRFSLALVNLTSALSELSPTCPTEQQLIEMCISSRWANRTSRAGCDPTNTMKGNWVTFPVKRGAVCTGIQCCVARWCQCVPANPDHPQPSGHRGKTAQWCTSPISSESVVEMR